MKGFKEFLLRGNLIELAVAFIMAASFAAVVEKFTAMVMDIIGKLGGTPDFSSVSVAGVAVGPFLTALVAFILMAAVVYFLIVRPYQALRDRLAKKEEAAPEAPSQEELLTEIRDLLKQK